MITTLKHSLELVKFSHTIFALPFALMAFFLASQREWDPLKLFWVILCVVTARFAAMAFNRLVDARIDAKNPRTQNRHIPQGLLSRSYVISMVIVFSLGFMLSAAQLNRLTFFLAPFCLVILFFYSYAKRFTPYTHLILGLCLALAPIGATVAIKGSLNLSSLILGMAVLFWVAGFDLLYALQDQEFDRKHQLHSLAVSLGTSKTLQIAKYFHLIFLALLGVFGFLNEMGTYYWVGFGLTSFMIFYEHFILDEKLTRIQAAFFTSNGILSVLFCGFVILDIYF